MIKPYNNRIKVIPLSSKEKENNIFEIPHQLKKKEERHHDEKYINVEIVDISNDVDLTREGWLTTPGSVEPVKVRFVDNILNMNAVIETFALEEVNINGETHYFIPLQSVICIYNKE